MPPAAIAGEIRYGPRRAHEGSVGTPLGATRPSTLGSDIEARC